MGCPASDEAWATDATAACEQCPASSEHHASVATAACQRCPPSNEAWTSNATTACERCPASDRARISCECQSASGEGWFSWKCTGAIAAFLGGSAAYTKWHKADAKLCGIRDRWQYRYW